MISRSGVASYRSKTRDIKQIGRDLGVANVLEGSVQISGDRVRINVQLVDTRTEAQIWAEHYDRKVEDLFALQSELAQTIVAQLKATLSSREKAAIWKRPTQDMQAYDLYLRARAAMNDARVPEPNKAWPEVVQLLEKALARDPSFALAYCLLSEAHVYIYRYGDDHSPQRLAAVKDAAETALRLEPNLEEARLALARYYYDGLVDYRGTEQQLSMLAPSGAHEVEYYSLAGLVERRLAKWPEAIRDSKKAAELDPQAPQLAYNLAQNFAALRQYDEALRVVDEATERLPVSESGMLWRLKSEIEIGRGDLPAAGAALDMAHDNSEPELARLWLLLLNRDFEGARSATRNARQELKANSFYWLTIGLIYRAAGEAPEAREAFQTARRLLELALEKRPAGPELLSELAEADAGLGREEEAIRGARRAVEICPPSVDAIVGQSCGTWLAEVLTWTGDRDGALNILSTLVQLPFGPNYGELKFNPMWDELRGDPRFDRILAETQRPITLKDNADSRRP